MYMNTPGHPQELAQKARDKGDELLARKIAHDLGGVHDHVGDSVDNLVSSSRRDAARNFDKNLLCVCEALIGWDPFEESETSTTTTCLQDAMKGSPPTDGGDVFGALRPYGTRGLGLEVWVWGFGFTPIVHYIYCFCIYTLGGLLCILGGLLLIILTPYIP